jgi:hypothetical protein
MNSYQLQWRSLGLFSSEATHRAQRGGKMLGVSPEIKKTSSIPKLGSILSIIKKKKKRKT